MSDIRGELIRIYTRDGVLTPEAVVVDAAAEDSPLHSFFVWDDTEAARRYRLVQAGSLIRRCKITVETGKDATVRVRQFTNIPSGSGPGDYVPTLEALADNRRDIVMEQAVRDLTAVRHKYEALVDIDKAWAAARTSKRRRAA